MEKVPMTADGYAALDAEVKKLKGPERQRTARPLPKHAHMAICLKMLNITPPKSSKATMKAV